MSTVAIDIEEVDSFRDRARSWIRQNLPRQADPAAPPQVSEVAWSHARELQQLLFTGGFAGLCFPKEFGGQGLTLTHQRAFNEEVAGYEMPIILNTPNISICGATIFDLGSEAQKQRYLRGIISGELVFCQFLSEPRGGSDLAGLITRATRDGDTFVVNGSKIWSSGAYAADYALCLTRTDWEAPKHRGLTMLIFPVHTDGVEINRIRQVTGNDEFCQEFFDDVSVPLENVLGNVNGGWAVASQQLLHERNSVGGGSPYVSGPQAGRRRAVSPTKLIDLVRRTGQADDISARRLVAESYALTCIQQQLANRVSGAVDRGQLPPNAGSIIRLFAGEADVRRAEIATTLAGPDGIASHQGGDVQLGVDFLFRQGSCLGGGTTEIARNLIAERVLDMPREYAADHGIPFSRVRQGPG
jgi:alkylation response protein AidB-like acyl-CoA dehydrogenase